MKPRGTRREGGDEYIFLGLIFCECRECSRQRGEIPPDLGDSLIV